MINITDTARERLKGLIDSRGEDNIALRLEIKGRKGSEFQYEFGFIGEEYAAPEDTVQDVGDFKVFISPQSAPDVEGLTLDFHEDDFQSGFKIDNPNPVLSGDMAAAVAQVITSEVNPAIAGHGGFVELLDVDADQGIVYIRMGGGCQGCGMADVTLKQGIEVRIREAVPAVMQIIDQTDHAGGENPYFQPAKGGGASPFG
jgi:Fe/S biogenesis protein NfuA